MEGSLSKSIVDQLDVRRNQRNLHKRAGEIALVIKEALEKRLGPLR
jgi:hypothetical protein